VLIFHLPLLTSATGTISEAIKLQTGDPCDSREILVEGEHACAMFQSNSRDQSVDCGEGNSSSSRCSVDSSRLSVGLKTTRLEELPLRQILLNRPRAPNEPLQNLGNDDAGKSERLAFLDQAAQFGAAASRSRAEEIYPDGTIDQDQMRFLRDALRSPLQTPFP
jgi:hypothetical protein